MKKFIILILILLLSFQAEAVLRKTTRFEFFNNSGGLNDKLSPVVIKDNEASDLQNVEFSQGGAIQKRKGFASDNLVVLNGSVTGLFQYKQNDGTKFFISTIGDKIYKEDDLDGVKDDITGGVTISSGSNYLFTFTTANNKLLATNSLNDVITWDGTGNATNITSAPQGKYIAFHQNIVFRVSVGDKKFSRSIYRL